VEPLRTDINRVR